MRTVYSDDRHQVCVGDVECGDVGELVGGRHVDAVYVDPPWNAGIAKMFRRWAGDERTVDMAYLMGVTVAEVVAACPDGPAFVQVAGQGHRLLLEGFAEVGWAAVSHVCAQVADERTWAPGKPAFLIEAHPFDFDPVAVERDWAFTELCARVLRQVVPAGGTVLDFYEGQGMTLRVCDREGWRCLAMELNAKRAATSVARLERDRVTGRSIYRC